MLSRISSSVLLKSKNSLGGQFQSLSLKSISAVSSSSRQFSSKNEAGFVDIPVDDKISQIDTTLTAEQQEYVNKLKKKMRGGVNSPRCMPSLASL